MSHVINLASPDWVRPKRFCKLTGLTLKALEGKRQRPASGWKEGVHFKWVDGGWYYSLRAYNEWVEKAPIRESKPTAARSGSRSPLTVSAVASR